MEIKVKVIPNASKERIQETTQGLRVYLSCPPEKGRANKRLIDNLSEYLGVKKSCLKIIKGRSSRDKVIKAE
jgi:uncharacterized protein